MGVTHSLTHSLAHSLTHSLTHVLTAGAVRGGAADHVPLGLAHAPLPAGVQAPLPGQVQPQARVKGARLARTLHRQPGEPGEAHYCIGPSAARLHSPPHLHTCTHA